MSIPVDKFAGVLKAGLSARHESDAPLRVTVLVDATATPFLIETVREALVPLTTSAIVRVGRISESPVQVKHDTDVTIVLTGGSERLQGAVQEAVIAGAPVVVLVESSVDAPFITEDTPMLGLIAATDKTYLLEKLARWILDHTDKEAAFASNFAFMRIAAASRVIVSTALANMATGALVFIPGADFPVMAAAQLGMLAQLSSMYGMPIRFERGYEAAGLLAGGLALRAVARQVVRYAGKGGFAAKALIAGFGTYAMGRALCAVYERDIDYGPLNELIGGAIRRGRDFVRSASGPDAASAGPQGRVA